MLHVAVGRVCKTFLLLACCIQTNQVTSDVFYFIFRPLFESFPLTATESCYRRFAAFASFVFADAVQVMNTNEYIRSVAVVEFDHLLRLTVHRRRDETSELRNTMIAVYDVVTYLQLVDLAQGDDRFAASCVFATHHHAVETLEDLMVGIAANLQSLVHKPFMQGAVYPNKQSTIFTIKRSVIIPIIERSAHDRLQSVQLFLLLG